MFENTVVHEDDPWGRFDEAPEGDDDSGQIHELDSPENQELHGMLLSYYRQELDRQYDNRMQMGIDADFYDHIQWTSADENELGERGQSAIVYNVTAQTCNWIMGSEKRGRVDFKVLPRRKDDGTSAERKTAILKYLSDVNKTPFHRSRAFEDTVKVGIGWLEDGLTDDDDGEPIYSRYESWRNMLWDSSSTEMDLSDARYLTRSKWVDTDIAKSLAPDRSDLIEMSKEDGALYGFDGQNADEVMDMQELELDGGTERRATDFTSRDRVRLIEVWFKKPVEVERIIKGTFKGDIYDESNPHPVLQEFIEQNEEAGTPVIASRVMMRVHVAIMTVKGLLYVGPSPYRHNRYPFTPVWGYRRDRDGLPYGVIRGLRDIQEDINKRASKAQYILSTNKVVMDEGAVDDIEEFRREVSRPDAIIQKKKGYQLDINVDRDLSQWQLELFSRNIAMIQQVGGVTDEQMGRTTNATSGKAVEARQEQGAMTTSKLFDNLRYAYNDQGAKQLSLVEQFMLEEKQFRITNQRGTPEYITVNDGMPENDIVRQKADFVISEGEWRATLRQAQAEQLLEMLSRMQPQVALVLLDLVIELMDIENRDEIVNRIRQMNGMSDPDADPDSPEEQAKKQAQAAQQRMQQAMIEAELRDKLADAGVKESKVAEMAAKIAKTNVDAQDQAIKAAIDALLNPGAAPVADQLLHESGFVSRTENEQTAQVVAEQQQAAIEQQQMDGAAPDGAIQPQPV